MADTIDVVSPADQEGTEAVVLRWLKKIGENVARNEPLLELETDKVTVEIAAPASGRVAEIMKNEQDAVEPGAVLGRISTVVSESPAISAIIADATAAQTAIKQTTVIENAHPDAPLSPAVKRMLAEHRLDMKRIPASGKGGRLTAQDITRYLEGQNTYRPATPLPTADAGGRGPAGSRRIPHTQIRKRIAQHMLNSMATAPHVTTVFQADLTRVMAHRKRHLKTFEAQGIKLTYTAYFVAAAVKALQAVPEVNSRFHDDALEIFADCNIGIGTALGNEGLIVPVLHRAQTLGLLGTAQKLGELVNAARANKLAPEAVRGGTFTISNHGVGGSLFAAPIVINQPQVAILGIGKLEKRVVVEELEDGDVIRIKPMCYLTLTIDHRALDAFQANAFLTSMVSTLESWAQD